MTEVNVKSECAFGCPTKECISGDIIEMIAEKVLNDDRSANNKPDNKPDNKPNNTSDNKPNNTPNQPIETGGIKDHPATLLAKVEQVFQCDSESCLLAHPEVIKLVGEDTIEREKKKLKPYGPKDHKWFNNFNIDSVLEQFQRIDEYKFFHYPFAMMDFASYGHPLMKKPPAIIYDEGKRCYGCVINTDKISGPGKHWMALFGDMRDDHTWTVEFFNSSGNPYSEVTKYLVFAEQNMKQYIADKGLDVQTQIIPVLSIEHQKSNTECGPYSLYYIWSRLTGVTPQEIDSKRIPDSTVTKFRDFIFRDYE